MSDYITSTDKETVFDQRPSHPAQPEYVLEAEAEWQEANAEYNDAFACWERGLLMLDTLLEYQQRQSRAYRQWLVARQCYASNPLPISQSTDAVPADTSDDVRGDLEAVQ